MPLQQKSQYHLTLDVTVNNKQKRNKHNIDKYDEEDKMC